MSRNLTTWAAILCAGPLLAVEPAPPAPVPATKPATSVQPHPVMNPPEKVVLPKAKTAVFEKISNYRTELQASYSNPEGKTYGASSILRVQYMIHSPKVVIDDKPATLISALMAYPVSIVADDGPVDVPEPPAYYKSPMPGMMGGPGTRPGLGTANFSLSLPWQRRASKTYTVNALLRASVTYKEDRVVEVAAKDLTAGTKITVPGSDDPILVKEAAAGTFTLEYPSALFPLLKGVKGIGAEGKDIEVRNAPNMGSRPGMGPRPGAAPFMPGDRMPASVEYIAKALTADGKIQIVLYGPVEMIELPISTKDLALPGPGIENDPMPPTRLAPSPKVLPPPAPGPAKP